MKILKINTFSEWIKHHISWDTFPITDNLISGIMVNVLASSVVDRGFKPRSGQTKNYKIGVCCFPTKHAPLRRKNKDWLARNQYNVSKWGNISTRGLLVYYKADLIIISLKMNLFSPWYSWKNGWVGIKQQSPTNSLNNRPLLGYHFKMPQI